MTDGDKPIGYWQWIYRCRNLFAIIEREPTTLRGSSAWQAYLDGKRDSGHVSNSREKAAEYTHFLTTKSSADHHSTYPAGGAHGRNST